ncbi:MAG: hypothetical protein KKD44_24530 [Proteobacteria bacterium]|nr:hypothetical protein [Pseudomonadota bacterium]
MNGGIIVRNDPVNAIDPLGLKDYYLFVDIDSVPILGGEGGFGVVFDSDNWMDSGVFGTAGPAGGANAGIGVGWGKAERELEGISWNIDANIGMISPTISFDDEGYNGYAWSFGPGGGISFSGTITGTYSINDLIRDWKGDNDNPCQ